MAHQSIDGDDCIDLVCGVDCAELGVTKANIAYNEKCMAVKGSSLIGMKA